MEKKLSTFITGFEKSHEIKIFLITMKEKQKNSLPKEEFVNAIFKDLSKNI